MKVYVVVKNTDEGGVVVAIYTTEAKAERVANEMNKSPYYSYYVDEYVVEE